MPLFDYKCPVCGRVTEEFSREGKPLACSPRVELSEAPACPGLMERVWAGSTSSFVLKGDGWYRDGYASSKRARSE